MDHLEPEGVRAAALRFRMALQEGGLLLYSLADFPHGACGDASELLGQYLRDTGLGSWLYRSCNTPPSHAWIESSPWIVDITADQFEDVAESVIVTMNRSWHDDRFPSAPGRRTASLDWFDSSLVGDDARADYATLRARADQLSRAPGVR